MLPSRILRQTQDTVDQKNLNIKTRIAKITAMCVLFFVSFIIGILPIKLNKWFHWSSDPTSSTSVKITLGIGGGALLCTTFIHMLPEISKNFKDINITPDAEVPYAELLMCIGFFAMYLIEESVITYMLTYKKPPPPNNLELQKSQDIIEAMLKGTLTRRPGPMQPSGTEEHPEVSGELFLLTGDSTAAIIRGMMLILALCVHELFEGLAVGLEKSPQNVWYMFAAISAHKFIISYCIGVELVTSGLKPYLVIIYVFIFSFVSAAGIGIGILVSKIGSTTNLISAIMQGVACGTLLYVVFFDIVQGDRRRGLKQFGAVFLGFFIMFGVTAIEIFNV